MGVTKKAGIGIFGAGWVGLVTGACFADLGHSVVIRDVVPERVDALRAGGVPIHEEGLAELLERNRDRLSFTLDAAEVGPTFVDEKNSSAKVGARKPLLTVPRRANCGVKS